jgi:hypothetical protein
MTVLLIIISIELAVLIIFVASMATEPTRKGWTDYDIHNVRQDVEILRHHLSDVRDCVLRSDHRESMKGTENENE